MTKANNEKMLLIILDGWGVKAPYEGNAITRAKTPTFDRLWLTSPRAVLEASGEAVGLPPGQIGTSEVNHMTIGAGRVIFQDLVRINKAIQEKTFFKNPTFQNAFQHVKKHRSTLHLQGLVSSGGVHSHQEHMFALIEAARDAGVKKIYIHVFTDGRDVLPQSAKEYVKELEDRLKEIGVGKIASISGRYYAMDRDHNWDRTDKSFTVLTQKGGKKYSSALEAIDAAYKAGITDEFIEPAKIEVESGEEGTVSSNDAVIFVNFRNDRPRQLTERFLEQGPENLHFVTMTQYHPEYRVKVAYEQISTDNTLGEILSQAGVKQLRLTETEKFAHITFFFNCKREEPFEGEDRIMLDSYSDIKTHDERPAMRTPDLANMVIDDMEQQRHQVIMTNWCNADMVGHSGKIEAAIEGVEAIDTALAKVLAAADKNDYHVLITADHGNAEEMIDERSGQWLTAHTLNPVPFILVSKKFGKLNRESGDLTGVAPTILKILDLDPPKEMTGESFI